MSDKQNLFSIITIVNKEDVYQKFKDNIAEQKKVNYELIKINNGNNQFSSAREAYNGAIKRAHGNYLVFLHPDMRFLDEYALHDIFDQIIIINDFGVVGVAGCPFELYHHKSVILTTMVQGIPSYHFGKPITKATKIQTLDECFFVMKKAICEAHPFSDI